MENVQPMFSENPAQATSPAPELVQAGFWLRAGAYMIDGIILTIAQIILMAVCGLIMPPQLSSILSTLLVIAYFTWMPVAHQGQTLGKMVAGISIIRTDLTPLTYARCFFRWVGYLVSGILLGIGFIIAAFTNHKRSLHDYMVGTRVIRSQEIPTGRKIAVIALGFTFPLLLAVVIIAAMAGTQFAKQSPQNSDSLNKSDLQVLRTAIAAYQGDNNNASPTDLALLFPKYLPTPPQLRMKDHPESAQFQTYDSSVCAGQAIDGTKISDSGKWGYVSDPKASCFGTLFIDCTHQDSEGKPWFSH